MKPSTYKAYAATVRTWIIPTVGRRRLAQLGPQDMRALTGAMDAAGRSSTSQGQAQRLLAKILRDAIVEGHDVPQRALLAPAPKNAVTTRSAIPFEDAMRILDVARARPDASRWVAALLQGQRQGETLGLTWECVDLDAGTITVAWQLQKLKYADREAGAFRVPAGYETRQLHGAWHLVRPKSRAGWRTTPIVPWMRAQLEAIRPADALGLAVPYDAALGEKATHILLYADGECIGHLPATGSYEERLAEAQRVHREIEASWAIVTPKYPRSPWSADSAESPWTPDTPESAE